MYRSPDHYYNIFHQEKLVIQMHSVPGVYIKNRQYFKFVMFLSKEVEIDMNFYMKKEFCKNIDYFLRYFAICEQIFPTFSYIAQLLFLHTMGKLPFSPFL